MADPGGVSAMRMRFRKLAAMLRRKPKTHLVPIVNAGDTIILLHQGTAWRALRLMEVTSDRERTIATFESMESYLQRATITRGDAR